MSDSDNYFSDSDNSVIEEDKISSEKDEDYESSDNEMDEETRRIIYQSLQNKKDDTINSFYCQEKNVPIKQKKVRERKIKNTGLSLLDFEKKIEENKPKKWKSKRSQEKKTELGIVNNTKVRKRQFNPRLPPPTFETFKKKETDEPLDMETAFPSLSDSYKVVDV